MKQSFNHRRGADMSFPLLNVLSKPLKSMGIALSALVSFVPMYAESFPAEHLPADHEWFAHLDFEKAHSGPLKPLIEGIAGQTQVLQHLIAIEAFTGFNVQRDLRSVTVSGPAGDEVDGQVKIEAGVLMVTGTYDPARLELAMRAIPNISTLNLADRKFYRFP